MSKHLLSFLLSELATVRVICQQCGTIVELPIGNLGMRFSDGTCRICKREIFPPDKEKALLNLANAIAVVQEASQTVQLEFVLSVPSAGTSAAQP